MNEHEQSANNEHYKQQAAEAAVALVESGMAVGLGTGSTAIWVTRRIAALLREGKLHDVVGFPTSRTTAAEAQALGIPLLDDALPRPLALTIDGADEIDAHLNLIKGAGGALFREKVAAEASARMLVVADRSKLVTTLGERMPVPVEVTPFGWHSQQRFLESLGAGVALRHKADGGPFQTDQGNWVFDCRFGPIADPALLAAALDGRAGIVEHGLFINRASAAFVAGPDGVQTLTREL
jgi:ribose 5-phosphate isomerase A